MAVHDLERIEQKIDRVTAGAIAVSDTVGGVAFSDMSQLLEFAKLLALAGTAVPKHLRGNPGACMAITIQALEWKMSPIAVANKSYEVNDRIAYEGQLIHAVVEARAPLKNRLRFRYEGEDDQLCCIVTGHFKGEVEAVEYRSPAVGKIKVKNSPLWISDVQQQLAYYSARSWARRYCPDVLLGIYAADEIEETGATARDITPNKSDVGSRLKGGKKAGFEPKQIEQTISETAGDPKTGQPETVSNGQAEPESGAEETARQRGTRLLPLCMTERDVADLRATISDELPEEQQQAWAIACDARQADVRKSSAVKGKK